MLGFVRSALDSLKDSLKDNFDQLSEHVVSTVKHHAQTLNMEVNNRSIQLKGLATTTLNEYRMLAVSILIPLIFFGWFGITVAACLGFSILRRPITVWLTRIRAWGMHWFEGMQRREIFSSTDFSTSFQTKVNEYLFRSKKIVSCNEPQVDHYSIRTEQITSKLFQTAAPLVKFTRPGGSDTRAVQVANVRSVGIFGLQKVGKTTLLNKLFGLGLRTGNSANWQTTTGVDLTAISGYAVFDSEGAGSEDAMLKTRSRLNTAIPGQEDDVFHYVENFRENIELAFMAVVMTVCNPVILCVKEPSAVTNFMKRVLLMANKVAGDETASEKRVLIIVQNFCSRDAIENSREPAFIHNARANRNFAQNFVNIEFVAIPDFNSSPRQIFQNQVDYLRTLINGIDDKSPLDQVLSSVDQVVTAIQETQNDEHVNVDEIWTRSTQEFCDQVCENLKSQFEASANRLNTMSEDQFESLRSKIRESWGTLNLPERCATWVGTAMTPWMRDQFDTRFRACPETCGCTRGWNCSMGRIGHEGSHKCRFTETSSCSRCLGRILQCNDGCQHCQTTCAKHPYSFCTKEESHSLHLFGCTHLPKCEGVNCSTYTASPIQCGKQFICKHCSCEHTFARKHSPIKGRGFTGEYWECATRGCKFNDDASRYHVIRANEDKDGCIKECGKCGFSAAA